MSDFYFYGTVEKSKIMRYYLFILTFRGDCPVPILNRVGKDKAVNCYSDVPYRG